MSGLRRGPDDMGDDEQQTEIDGWTDELPAGHVIDADDPADRDDLTQRTWREARDRERVPREDARYVRPDEGAHPDEDSEEYASEVGEDDGDFSAEERAMHIERP
ncbi:hypothetical protein Sme01_11520 [Sphaerisporangium melleum]|uniref:DUF5709 domain-containing protein n=1 Tax=Sphaerisporangium melleum TaxID=321316 RepID=A0A917VRN2_9ACTN|nr:DUF5709 domain-containing protein [Sphaerisporangium melleum]GGL07576.1 hypothetical protein GCM10007964_57260 [Sphaerisporangium melleum]GII68676.1 hypothetical protein Sme01_11520 [Sphaerisporangium melleum]